MVAWMNGEIELSQIILFIRVEKKLIILIFESYGSVKKKVYYFLNDKGQLGSIGQSENFEEELSEIINILK